MLVEAMELHPDGYALVAYNPPADGLPWLVVCLGPQGRLVATVAANTAEEASFRLADSRAELNLKPPTDEQTAH